MKGSEMKRSELKEISPSIKAPLAPNWVLLIAIMLPGMGQVVNNTPLKGLVMVTLSSLRFISLPFISSLF